MSNTVEEKINKNNQEFAEKLDKTIDDKIKVKIDYGNPVKDGVVTGLAVVGGAVLAGAAIYGVMALINGPVIEDISFNEGPNNWI